MDGNGRIARAYLDAVLTKVAGDRVPILVYRLSPSCPPQAYIDATRLLYVGDPAGLTHTFWVDALLWGDRLQLQIEAILFETQRKINSKIGLAMMGESSIMLLKYLWAQPIVCEKGLVVALKMDWSTSHTAISELVNYGILTAKRLRNPVNAIIYDCPLILTAYNLIDDAIFTTT